MATIQPNELCASIHTHTHPSNRCEWWLFSGIPFETISLTYTKHSNQQTRELAWKAAHMPQVRLIKYMANDGFHWNHQLFHYTAQHKHKAFNGLWINDSVDNRFGCHSLEWRQPVNLRLSNKHCILEIGSQLLDVRCANEIMKSNFQANGFHDGNGGDEIETFEIMIHRL